MSEPEEPNEAKHRNHRRLCMTVDRLVKLKAHREGIPESEVKLTLAIPLKDGRRELTLEEINEISRGF